VCGGITKAFFYFLNSQLKMDQPAPTPREVKLPVLTKPEAAAFRTWRRSVEFIVRTQAWDDWTAIGKIYNAIQGDAAEQGHRVPPALPPRGSNLPVPTTASYLERLQKIFIPASNQFTAFRALQNMKQHRYEHPRDWGQRLFNTYCDAHPGQDQTQLDQDVDLVLKFAAGLLDGFLNMAVYNAMPKTLTEAIEVAVEKRNILIQAAAADNNIESLVDRPGLAYDNQEGLQDGLQQLQRPRQSNFRSNSSNSNYRGANTSTYNYRGNNRQLPPRNRQNNTGQRRQTPRPTGCWSCGKPGHTRIRCPNKGNNRNNGGRNQRSNTYLRVIQQLSPDARDQFIASLESEPNWEEDCPDLADALHEAEEAQLAMMDAQDGAEEQQQDGQQEN